MKRFFLIGLVLIGVALPFVPLACMAGSGTVGVAETAALAPSCTDIPGSIGGPPSPLAKDAIPSNLMPIYHQAESKYKTPWNWLAGVNKVETDFGQNLNVSGAGAIGWMQFMPATWASYGVDADHDGHKDPYNPWDAIFAAARYLHALGAPGDMHRAVLAYNHAEWYYQEVKGYALKYALNSPLGDPVDTGGSCGLADTGVPGKVVIAPGANLPGKPVTPATMTFLARAAGIYGKQLICTTGTNHSYLTVNGNVSDHASGHACDFGMIANGGADDSPVGDKIATACLMAARVPAPQATQEARAGGLYTVVDQRDHLRVQCIWKTYEGGNHHNHVHMGAMPI